MRIALAGAGCIARLVLEHLAKGDLRDLEVVAIHGRTQSISCGALAQSHRIPFVDAIEPLLASRPQVVLEAASHAWVQAHAEAVLSAGVSLIVLSAGALADDVLRQRVETAAAASGALLYVPSGGIGGLDALKAAVLCGADEVMIRTAKPPRAWVGIPYVDSLGVDLQRLDQPYVLYDGPARAGVKHFPQNVNIAAVLAMAGLGFDRTRLVAVADPGIDRNTHVITVKAVTGEIDITLQNVPSPDNPKTAWLACYSALAAVRQMQSPARYGT
jgi:aspartate dehydrogenase